MGILHLNTVSCVRRGWHLAHPWAGCTRQGCSAFVGRATSQKQNGYRHRNILNFDNCGLWAASRIGNRVATSLAKQSHVAFRKRTPATTSLCPLKAAGLCGRHFVHKGKLPKLFFPLRPSTAVYCRLLPSTAVYCRLLPGQLVDRVVSVQACQSEQLFCGTLQRAQKPP